MTVEEVKGAINELKNEGLTEIDIAEALYNMYRANKIDLDQFGALVKLVGFELNIKFIKEEMAH